MSKVSGFEQAQKLLVSILKLPLSDQQKLKDQLLQTLEKEKENIQQETKVNPEISVKGPLIEPDATTNPSSSSREPLTKKQKTEEQKDVEPIESAAVEVKPNEEGNEEKLVVPSAIDSSKKSSTPTTKKRKRTEAEKTILTFSKGAFKDSFENFNLNTEVQTKKKVQSKNKQDIKGQSSLLTFLTKK